MSGFAARHGLPEPTTAGEAVVLSAPDGAIATLRAWRPAAQAGLPASTSSDAIEPGVLGESLAAWAAPPPRLALLLVRRGGYAVGLADGDQLVAHHCGTRYVQGRTRKGGWSQQRYARRRGHQADALVVKVADQAARVLLAGVPAEGLVLGGDRRLAAAVLDDPRLSRLAALPRRGCYDLPDPRLTVLEQAVRRGRALRVEVSQPGADPGADH